MAGTVDGVVVMTVAGGTQDSDHVVVRDPMNIDLLKKYFQKEWVVASTANTLITPSSLTKEMAKQIADTMPVEPMMASIATILAKGVADKLLQSAMRPADYQDMRDLPDALIEKVIEELAKKPVSFFKAFQDSLKLQG